MSPSAAADISQNAADAVFQGEKLGAVVETLKVARRAHRMALENFAIAILYNAAFVPMAVLGYVTPLLAAMPVHVILNDRAALLGAAVAALDM